MVLVGGARLWQVDPMHVRRPARSLVLLLVTVALVAAGWLQSVGRGTWTIPAPRVVPLLVVVSAGLAR